MFDFKNQVVIVTGGTRGIARGISEAFLKAGATVIATYCYTHEKPEQFKNANTAFNDHVDIQKFDILNYSQVEHFYTNIYEKYNAIDVLVNNAGIRRDSFYG